MKVANCIKDKYRFQLDKIINLIVKLQKNNIHEKPFFFLHQARDLSSVHPTSHPTVAGIGRKLMDVR